jgi:glucose/arabinose dehydrogenase
MRKLTTLGLLGLILAACGGTAGPEPDAAPPGAAIGPPPATLATPASAEGGSLSLRLVQVARNLSSPVFLTFAPGETGRLYVVEQVGRIRLIAKGRVQKKPFLDIRGLVRSGGERGLLSMAFHPDYKTNRLFYVNYTNLNGDTVVAEYRTRTGGRSPARVRQILFVNQPYANHNGGQLQFGPDGLLYVGMGDGGAAGDPGDMAQDLSSRLGKLLRIDVDRPGADWELVAYGLRNPWRFSFDRLTDDLYIADVGQGDWEEIDFTPRSSPGLENYGWDVYEGNHRYEDKQPSGNGELVFPVHEYSHDDGCSVTGGYVYRGSKIPAARGRYFFGDYCFGTIWSFVVENGRATDVRRHSIRVDEISSFGEGKGGEIYVVSLAGDIFRIAPG